MNDTALSNHPAPDLDRLVRAAQESLTDGMVERLASTAGNALEVVDRLNDEDSRETVLYLIDRLTDLHCTGGLETLFPILTLIHGLREAMTDSMVERLFAFKEHMINNLANEDVADLASNAQQAMTKAAREVAGSKPTGGLLSTISMLSKPESQQALQYLLAFACRMRALQAREDG
ncbi:MAG: hypothetical protein VW405_04595 [Rhodospirillaceae bacterium]